MSSDEHPAIPSDTTAGTPDDPASTPTPDEPGARLVDLLGPPAEASVSGGGEHARATVDVPPQRWAEAVQAARDQIGCGFFDWLSAVDEEADGFSVVAHLWSVPGRYGVLLRTRLPRADPRVASVVELFPGASWHERETYEMFGVVFDGHPDLKPLLLPAEFEGHPLRKDFVLASRVAKPWPGAKEPGESEHTPARGKRQPMRPPGVPDEWGPQAGAAQEPTPAAKPAAGRSRPAGNNRVARSDRDRGQNRDGEQ
jgi:NADH-quinone oxidoreductase subunit C